MTSIFGWASEILSLGGIWIAGKSRLGWLVGLFGSACWFIYGLLLHQVPLWAGALCYVALNIRNWFVDTRKLFMEKSVL